MLWDELYTSKYSKHIWTHCSSIVLVKFSLNSYGSLTWFIHICNLSFNLNMQISPWVQFSPKPFNDKCHLSWQKKWFHVNNEYSIWVASILSYVIRAWHTSSLVIHASEESPDRCHRLMLKEWEHATQAPYSSKACMRCQVVDDPKTL
jgi:hypothetical protein